MMAQRRLIAEIGRDRPGRLEPDHARRRPQVVDDAVGPREPGESDDFLVVDPFALEARVAGDGRCAACAGSSRVEDRAAWTFLRDLVLVQGWATTRLRKVPSRSIASSTTSPGLSQPPAASGVSSRMQPVPTVPEPSTSPGRKRGVAAGMGQQLGPRPVHRTRVSSR